MNATFPPLTDLRLAGGHARRAIGWKRRTRRACPPAKRNARAFTLIEVLATLLLMAIVLPAAMQGISLAVRASSTARHRSEAAGLAESKLAELVATGDWQTSAMSGNFDGDFTAYSWAATVSTWDQDTSGENLQQIDLKVTWTSRNKPESLTLSTLTYVRTST